MNTQTLSEVLDMLDSRRMLASSTIQRCEAMSSLHAQEYIFVAQDSSRFQHQFVHGINANFMTELHELQRRRPVIFTTTRHAETHVLTSQKPVPVHNTGPDPLHTGHRITVIPPLCATSNAVRVDNRFLLQTVDYDKFKREFQHLCIWLRIFGENQLVIGKPAVFAGKEFWRRMYKAAEEELKNNSLWVDLIDAICRDGHIADMSEACKKMAEVSGRYWSPFLGINSGTVSSAIPELFRRGFTTSRQALTDLLANFAEVQAINPESFNNMKDEALDDDNAASIALTSLNKSQLEVNKTISYLADYTVAFKPNVIGSIHCASSSVVKSGEKMDVMLCQ